MPTARAWAPGLPTWAAPRHTDQYAFVGDYAPPEPVLLAEDATDARQAMPCGLCPHQVWPGDRVARLTDGTSRWAHLGCIAASAP